MAPQESTIGTRHHRRIKSSVLSNISFIHKRTSSTTSVKTGNSNNNFTAYPNFVAVPCNPIDYSSSKALEERHFNKREPQQLSRSGFEPGPRSLKKKSVSSLSSKSSEKIKNCTEASRVSDYKHSKLTKSKTSSNIATLLSRPKSLINLRKEAAEHCFRVERNKENEIPNNYPEKLHTPIYAQFSSEQYNIRLENEINLYTPKEYTPKKQRNFFENGKRPTLGKRGEPLPRPRSNYLPSSFSIQDISRRVSGGSRHSVELIRRVSGKKHNTEKKSAIPPPKPDHLERPLQSRGQRVLAAVSSSFGIRADSEADGRNEKPLNEDNIDVEFEAMLDRRNIPDHQRGKMRSLAMSMKKDFIRQDWAEIVALKNSKLEMNSNDNDHSITSVGADKETETRSKRPRSRTFTLSRSIGKDFNISSKKTKPEITLGKNLRKKSNESLNGSRKIFNGAGAVSAQNIIAKAKGQTPDDFVSYMKRVPKPEQVEVGRLHKLRLLLRNETVAWTDNFIGQGGMEEIVGLLERTMAVEWREEHEDALLHEVLLCLKGLSTTELALKHLDKMQVTLFPALLRMLFDKEKKGPSEFTTRNIITSLIFTYLKSAPFSEREKRAKMVLSYFRNPEPSESQRPIGFVLEMRKPRPYQVWCKEVVNVTKEVFWIFLHNLNVISLPRPGNSVKDPLSNPSQVSSSTNLRESEETLNHAHFYMLKHFPQERAPIAAAPYVGGVEWDATNYLASHLDLVNGILACLPNISERNSLREEMLASGWEKCMGGTLRLCKEKFYSSVHAGLSCWVAAAADDGWDTQFVRCGPRTDNEKKIPPKKTLAEQNPAAPKIALNFIGKNVSVEESNKNWI
ncbi:putative gtpase binding protein rid1 [Golovinomyces cichoracearum]|uniref:Putative gtpase binding protein rid1 n=1 Tax=Golovinomyces cichoracearum TaxID=62708 RepID=A0A420IY72_9PEZI|nr:putative gtpase binding protein rid1 [Golovinomyces cichoracearum]